MSACTPRSPAHAVHPRRGDPHRSPQVSTAVGFARCLGADAPVVDTIADLPARPARGHLPAAAAGVRTDGSTSNWLVRRRELRRVHRGVRRPHRAAHLGAAGLGGGAVLVAGRAVPRIRTATVGDPADRDHWSHPPRSTAAGRRTHPPDRAPGGAPSGTSARHGSATSTLLDVTVGRRPTSTRSPSWPTRADHDGPRQHASCVLSRTASGGTAPMARRRLTDIAAGTCSVLGTATWSGSRGARVADRAADRPATATPATRSTATCRTTSRQRSSSSTDGCCTHPCASGTGISTVTSGPPP